MTQQERYRKLVAEHRCSRCGAKLPESWVNRKCAICKVYDADARRIARNKPKPIQPRKKPAGVLTISQVVRLASERHISYGEMVLRIEKEGLR